jgi:hypothetical protein
LRSERHAGCSEKEAQRLPRCRLLTVFGRCRSSPACCRFPQVALTKFLTRHPGPCSREIHPPGAPLLRSVVDQPTARPIEGIEEKGKDFFTGSRCLPGAEATNHTPLVGTYQPSKYTQPTGGEKGWMPGRATGPRGSVATENRRWRGRQQQNKVWKKTHGSSGNTGGSDRASSSRPRTQRCRDLEKAGSSSSKFHSMTQATSVLFAGNNGRCISPPISRPMQLWGCSVLPGSASQASRAWKDGPGRQGAQADGGPGLP